MSLTPREAAYLALAAFRARGARPEMILSELSRSGLDKRDAALAFQITNGTLQNAMLLDYVISRYCSTPVKKLQPAVVDILRLSSYQILLLDRVPARAAVAEGVELAKNHAKRASGLVNAVLRRVAENAELPDIELPTEEERLSVRYSHPLWLVRRLSSQYGPDKCEEILRADNTEPGVTIQVNTLKTDADRLLASMREAGVDAETHPFLPDALILRRAGDVTALPGYDEGLYYVQDAAARMAVEAAAPIAGMTVLDACSAPGGKAFASAIRMRDNGRVFARDIHKNKLALVEKGAKRLGISIISTSAGDARDCPEELKDSADVVIADAPCSGFGVLRKKPEIRFKSESETAALPEIQLSILRGAAEAVKPGGALIYSTCTILREENEDVARRFMDEDGRFVPEPFELPGVYAGVDGMTDILPGEYCDGFFICRMRRKK